jgi:tetratricopeptide (TPR) repeat protein
LAAAGGVQDPSRGGVELNPYIFHAANVALHAVAAVIVFLILRRLRLDDRASLIGALLFAVHPIQTEAVAWASGMKDLLAGALSLAALWRYLIHADDNAMMPRRRLDWWIGTMLFVAAMLAKPSAVTTPLLAGVLDGLVLRRPAKNVALGVLPWLIIAMPIALIAKLAQAGQDIEPVPAWFRPLIAGDAVAFYLFKVVWPVNLAMDYARTPTFVRETGAASWTWMIPIAVLAAGLIIAVRRNPVPLAAILLFFLAPLPVLGFTPFMFQFYSTTADHYVYVAMLGPAVFAAWLVARQPKWTAFAAVILMALGMLSLRQVGVWRETLTLFDHTKSVSPRSYAANNNLAIVRAQQQRFAEAAALLRQARATQPKGVTAIVNLREVLTMMGRRDEAIDLLREEVRLKQSLPHNFAGNYLDDPNYFGSLLLLGGQYDRAQDYFVDLTRDRPNDPQAARLLILAKQVHLSSRGGAD